MFLIGLEHCQLIHTLQVADLGLQADEAVIRYVAVLHWMHAYRRDHHASYALLIEAVSGHESAGSA